MEYIKKHERHPIIRINPTLQDPAGRKNRVCVMVKCGDIEIMIYFQEVPLLAFPRYIHKVSLSTFGSCEAPTICGCQAASTTQLYKINYKDGSSVY